MSNTTPEHPPNSHDFYEAVLGVSSGFSEFVKRIPRLTIRETLTRLYKRQPVRGIYFIWSPGHELLYVGMTNNLRVRIINHCNGGILMWRLAKLNGIDIERRRWHACACGATIKCDDGEKSDMPKGRRGLKKQILDRYHISFLRVSIEDERLRYLETYATWALKPKYAWEPDQDLERLKND